VKLGLAIREVGDAERTLAQQLNALGDRHKTDHDVFHLTETLQRIADGTYGRCEECDEPIPPARLKAIPTATLCVPCQSAAEFRAARSPQSTRDDEEAPHL